MHAGGDCPRRVEIVGGDEKARTVDQHIAQLRRKLGVEIVSVLGVGYRIDACDAKASAFGLKGLGMAVEDISPADALLMRP